MKWEESIWEGPMHSKLKLSALGGVSVQWEESYLGEAYVQRNLSMVGGVCLGETYLQWEESTSKRRGLNWVGGACLGGTYAQRNLSSVGGVNRQWNVSVWQEPI